MIDSNMERITRKIIGQRIARARQRAELKQKELGARIGLTQGAISNIEAGKQPIDVAELERYAEALGVDVSFFLMEWFEGRAKSDDAVLRLFNDLPEASQYIIISLMEKMGAERELSPVAENISNKSD